ncbi:BrnA antitoxin family protein [Methylobacterium segetis]|uniref:BrnA antitoxin family protein n=1 Tax=Methylobacterium segetis TaxID=2488750 RepID=UPI001045049A|nr:BrnA antitoxin family protein [Methylobacterium segetis]
MRTSSADPAPALAGQTDLARVDAHIVQADEYEEIPELTDAMMARAVPGDGADLARRRGRPRSENRKVLTALRLDPDVLAAFKASGPGWQTRINAVLRREAGRLCDGGRPAKRGKEG